MLTTVRHPAPARAPRPYLSADDPPSKRRILEAALQLFAARGLHAVTVRDIARHAGYTNPALFKYFESKDALALHLFERCYLDLYERASHALARGRPFPARLHALLDVFFSEIEGNSAAFLFVQDHLRELWPRVSRKTRARSILRVIRSTLDDAAKEKSVRPAGNRDLLVAVIVGTLTQVARMYHFGEFTGEAGDWRGELETVLRRIVAS